MHNYEGGLLHPFYLTNLKQYISKHQGPFIQTQAFRILLCGRESMSTLLDISNNFGITLIILAKMRPLAKVSSITSEFQTEFKGKLVLKPEPKI